MRILLVSGSLPPDPCGVGDYTDMLATALAKLPGTVVAVLSRAPVTGDPNCERPYDQLIAKSWRLNSFFSVLRTLRRWRPDVVHVQYPTRGYGNGWLPSFIPLLAMLAGARVIRTWHEALTRPFASRSVIQLLVPGPYLVVRPDFERRSWLPLRLLLRGRKRGLVSGASAIPASTLSAEALTKVRSEWLGDANRLVVFFGFLLPAKGVERLFTIADPSEDRLLIVGDTTIDPAYSDTVKACAATERWRKRAQVTGAMSSSDVANLIAAADVVVLPFIDGGGRWNSSIHAAIAQATPVIATRRSDVSPFDNPLVTEVLVDDDEALRAALTATPRWHSGRRADGDDVWARIAHEHLRYYGAAWLERE